MKRTPLVWVVVLIAVALVVVASLRLRRPPTATEPSPSPPAHGWVLRDTISANITTLDPIRIVDALTINVLSHVYQGLVQINEEGRIVPALAESWTVSDDGREWTFRIRRGVRFHPYTAPDGWQPPAELTAADAAASLLRAATAPGSMYGWAYQGVVATNETGGFDIAAPESHVLKIRLTAPFPLLNRLVTVAGWVYPADILRHGGSNCLEQTAVGTGPFRLVRARPDDRVELERFDAGWSADPASPARVEIHVQPDPVAALEGFRAGRFDLVEIMPGTFSTARRLAEQGAASLTLVTANSLHYVVLNHRLAPFDDVRVRRAVNLAVDRGQISKILADQAEPAYGFIPPCSPMYRGSDRIRAEGCRFDPEEARRLWRDYTAEKGPVRSLDLTVESGEFPETLAQFVQASLSEHLQVPVRLQKKTWPELLQDAFGGSNPMYLFWWNIVTPSDDIYFLFYMPGAEPPNGFNIGFYANPEFPGAFAAAFRHPDERDRAAHVWQLEDTMIRDGVAMPLAHRRHAFLLRKGLTVPITPYLRKYYAQARESR